MARKGPSRINCLLAVDKPEGCTSHDVVARARRALGERRVGHAGTLDPAATGVVVLGVGQATRLLGMLAQDVKSYVARIEFGSETTTDDAEGEVSRTAGVPSDLSGEAFARDALAGMLGPSMQVPPAFSAISVNGVRAYKAARAGDALELEPRPVTVHAADLIAVEAGDRVCWTVSFTVSKGTYIRALARDLGRALGTAAHLSGLRRTASGAVSLSQCLRVDYLSAETAEACALDPVACLGLPRVDLPERCLADIACGRPVPYAAAAPGTARALGAAAGEPLRACLVVSGRLVAVARAETDALRMQDVFPGGISGVSS